MPAHHGARDQQASERYVISRYYGEPAQVLDDKGKVLTFHAVYLKAVLLDHPAVPHRVGVGR